MAGAQKTEPYVMLVEDSDALRESLTSWLRDCGFHVRAAADGEAALRVVEDAGRPPVLVISDFALPKLNGCEVIQRIRDMPEGSTVRGLIITGGDAMPPPVDATFVMRKPFSAEGIRMIVASAFRIIDADRVLATEGASGNARTGVIVVNEDHTAGYRVLIELRERGIPIRFADSIQKASELCLASREGVIWTEGGPGTGGEVGALVQSQDLVLPPAVFVISEKGRSPIRAPRVFLFASPINAAEIALLIDGYVMRS